MVFDLFKDSKNFVFNMTASVTKKRTSNEIHFMENYPVDNIYINILYTYIINIYILHISYINYR